LLEEEEKHVDEIINARDDIFDDEIKDIIMREVRLVFIARLYKDREDWKRNLMELKDYNVIKMGRVLQSLFYLLEIQRNEICEKNTNRFFWKKAKH
jgi:hypothetical protein